MDTSSLNTAVAHRFKIGNMVHFIPNRARNNAAEGPYEILALLPECDGNFQYRVKNSLEQYQRIVQERDLCLRSLF
jgi:hypothetical protein